ncbi:MAG: DNA polymerase/3'-5' exonuclease PolX [Thermacetogeniaceae bacterium]
MNNWEIAQIFLEIADLLDILGENPFKSRAYRKAAQVLQNSSLDVEYLVKEDRLKEIPGIGAALGEKIRELVTTGKLRYYEELKKKVPEGLRHLLRIPGVGPKTVQVIYKNLNITSLEEVIEAAREQRLQQLPGIGKKTEEAIIKGIEWLQKREKRWLLNYASAVAAEIQRFLEELNGVDMVAVVGSYRRGEETVGDLDFVVASEKPSGVVEGFVSAPWVDDVLSRDENKAAVLTRWEIPVDLIVVEPQAFASALCYFTGSPAHNSALQRRAGELGLYLGDYGIIRDEKRKQNLYPESEEEFFELLGMSYIPPELREGRGEIDAALDGKIPRLVRREDLKGDLHVHTNWSDGLNTIAEMATAAKERGYSYLAITDHTRSLSVANGLDEERLQSQREEIDRLNRELDGFQLLAGMELEILPNKTLDFDDRVLAEMDIVIASIHSGFKQDRELLTERILEAMKNEHVDIIGHPTGRLLGKREPYELDLSRVLEAAVETGTALEINASPDRLDLKDEHIRLGKEMGVKFAISTDAHDVSSLDDIKYGLLTARRGWVEPDDVINAWPLPKLRRWLKKKS